MKNLPHPLEKIQKILANAGVGSRRQIELMIAAGEITVNGRKATLGDRASRTDRFRVKGKPIQTDATSRTQIIIYHKPTGEVCTRHDPEGRPTIFDHLPPLAQGRWINIGRLDINTSGLLLLTNSGELANDMMHPSQALEREYAVRVFGEVTPDSLKQLQKGVTLEDGLSRFESIKPAGGTGINQWFHVVLKRGRHREVRRLWESQGLQVSRLIRIRFGEYHLPRNLRPGQWQKAAVKN